MKLKENKYAKTCIFIILLWTSYSSTHKREKSLSLQNTQLTNTKFNTRERKATVFCQGSHASTPFFRENSRTRKVLEN